LTGTIWLDPRTRELRVIEYRFTNVPAEWRPDRLGGSIEVHRFEPGFWVTRFWHQRTPLLRRAGGGASGGSGGSGGSGRERLLGFAERAVEVTAVVPAVDTTDRVATAVILAQREAETRARVASVAGIVVDSLGSPVADAEVGLLGTAIAATSDRTGRFTLAGLPTGTQVLRVRKIGYLVKYFAIQLAGGQAWDGRITIARAPQVLGEILVVGKYGKPARYANTTKYDDFYRRRAARQGRYLTREEIDASQARQISDLLARMPGIRIRAARPAEGQPVEFSTCPGMGVRVWIDGQKVSGPVEMVLPLINPWEVEVMEVYQGESQIPAEFRDGACAAIVMWTR
jgi:hypothetical protein